MMIELPPTGSSRAEYRAFLDRLDQQPDSPLLQAVRHMAVERMAAIPEGVPDDVRILTAVPPTEVWQK